MIDRKIKEAIKKGALGSPALRLAAKLTRPAAVILMYHSVQDRPGEFADSIGMGIIHATETFARQMELVAQRFQPVGLEEVLLFVRGEKKLPRRAVAVTFDDGFADNAELAAPILSRFGIQGVFYLTASLMGTKKAPWYSRLRYVFAKTLRKSWCPPGKDTHSYPLQSENERRVALVAAFNHCAPLAGNEQETTIRRIEADLVDTPLEDRKVQLMLSWDQARQLQREGHIVGSHTLTHPNLAHVKSEAVLHEELSESKRKIEAALGIPIAHFSYPHPALNPQWSEETVAMTRIVKYRSAVTTTRGRICIGADPLRLTRIGAPHQERQFLWELELAFWGRNT